MGRKRRKKVRTRPKPSLPTIFECPKCESNSIRVEIGKKEGTADIRCGNKDCGLKEEVKIKSYDEAVDIYGKWLDKYEEMEEEIEEEPEEEEKLEEFEQEDDDYDDAYDEYDEY
ncbi:MAG: transcription elongation factor 1 family protein [Candidatus Hermodarchaeota archaeon]